MRNRANWAFDPQNVRPASLELDIIKSSSILPVAPVFLVRLNDEASEPGGSLASCVFEMVGLGIAYTRRRRFRPVASPTRPISARLAVAGSGTTAVASPSKSYVFEKSPELITTLSK